MSRLNPRLRACALAATALLCASSALAHPPGRMTGGGSILCPGVARVTHGFELHCGTGDNPEGSNPPTPNSLEINFSGGENFHLTQLDVANCSLDPAVGTPKPDAPFNTMTGSGSGTFNQLPATIEFRLTDAAEPGAGADFAYFKITQGSTVVLDCGQFLEGGNHQAHTATGSKQ
ncbi:MAG TPA: hypothetical protein VN680_02590 [Burkholderiaceae bacterium]|jgi:hypothetical protein|nr:hypothetical protein [Burkholderiaceae bacterium]